MKSKPRVLAALAIAATVVGLLEFGIVAFRDNVDHPVATWTFGPDAIEVHPFDEVPTYDAMSLRVDLPWAGYVYVVSFDHLQGSVGYYPTEYLATDHRTPAKPDSQMHFFPIGSHELPGPYNGKKQHWFVPHVTGALSLCVVASREPLAELDRAIPQMRQVGNKAFQSMAMGSYMPRAGRNKVIGKKRLPVDVLLAAQNQHDSIEPGPMVPCGDRNDVYIKVLNIRTGDSRPGVAPPANPLSMQLQKMVKDKSGK